MRHQFLKGAAAGGIGAAVVLLASTAVAGTGIGGVFNLGQDNTVNATTALTGNTSGPQLRVKNSGAGPALELKVASGKAPITVNSSTKVGKLNADFLDGLDSTGFVHGSGQVRGFALTLTPTTTDKELLSIPGYGQLTAFCYTGDARVRYVNGSHSVRAWVSIIGDDTFIPATADLFDVPPSGVMLLPVASAAQPVSAVQSRMMLQYTTTSGLFTLQHVATVDVAWRWSVDGPTCSFVASTVAGPLGSFAP